MEHQSFCEVDTGELLHQYGKVLWGAGITELLKADVLGQEFYFTKPHLGAELLKNNGAYMFRNNEIDNEGQDTSLAPLRLSLGDLFILKHFF